MCCKAVLAQLCWSSANHCVIPALGRSSSSDRNGWSPSQDAELTLVIPLYGRWEYIRGHVAGFTMDPWFKTGKVRLLYVC